MDGGLLSKSGIFISKFRSRLIPFPTFLSRNHELAFRLLCFLPDILTFIFLSAKYCITWTVVSVWPGTVSDWLMLNTKRDPCGKMWWQTIVDLRNSERMWKKSSSTEYWYAQISARLTVLAVRMVGGANSGHSIGVLRCPGGFSTAFVFMWAGVCCHFRDLVRVIISLAPSWGLHDIKHSLHLWKLGWSLFPPIILGYKRVVGSWECI